MVFKKNASYFQNKPRVIGANSIFACAEGGYDSETDLGSLKPFNSLDPQNNPLLLAGLVNHDLWVIFFWPLDDSCLLYAHNLSPVDMWQAN